jgi:hypothetical protein
VNENQDVTRKGLTVTTSITSARCRNGVHYAATANLVLPEVAVLIMARLIMISVDPDPETVFPARIRFAADVFPADNLIHIRVFGVTDAELAAPYAIPDDGAPCPVDYAEVIDTVADDYGWVNLDDPADRRFRLHVSIVEEADREWCESRVGAVAVAQGHAPALVALAWFVA